MGIAANKLVAQIASKLRKPRGFVVVRPGDKKTFLEPLSLGKLPGIGAKTEAALAVHGLKLIGDLTRRAEAELKAALGNGWLEVLAMARGEDDRPVETEDEDAKSYSQQETFFEDVGEFAVIERVAKRMIDELLPKVRADRKRVRTITIKVRYGDFTQTTHGRSLAEASDLEAPFYPLVGPLLREAWNQRRKLRLVSVRFSGVEEGGAQLEMFAQTDEEAAEAGCGAGSFKPGRKDGRGFARAPIGRQQRYLSCGWAKNRARHAKGIGVGRVSGVGCADMANPELLKRIEAAKHAVLAQTELLRRGIWQGGESLEERRHPGDGGRCGHIGEHFSRTGCAVFQRSVLQRRASGDRTRQFR